MLTLVDRASNEVVQRGDRLASAPMADQCRPALLPLVEGLELVAGPVSDVDDFTFTHRRYSG